MQPSLDRAYELGNYWQDTPSLGRLDPPLDADEATIMGNLMRDAGLIG